MAPLPARRRRRPNRYHEDSSDEEPEIEKGMPPPSQPTEASTTGACTTTADSAKHSPSTSEGAVTQEDKEASDDEQDDAVVKEEDGGAPVSAGNDAPPSQVSLSQSEDDHIRHLDKSGALNHIVGSQSILTQELHDVVHDEDEEENNDQGAVPAPAIVSSVERSDSISSQGRAYAAAQSMGLLTQELTQESPPPPEEEGHQASSPTHAGSPARFGAVVEEEEETPVESSPVEPTMQLSQLSCLMDAAEVVEYQEERQVNEQLICSEDLPDDDLFDFDKDEEETTLRVSRVKPRPPLVVSQNIKTPKMNNSRLKPPQLPLALKDRKRKQYPVVNASTLSLSNKGDGKPKYSPSMSPQKRRKYERQVEQARSQSLAKRAAELAERTTNSPEIAKQLLLSMALVRTNPRTAPTTWPPHGSVIPEGFFWGTYPPLENVLRTHMREYYELSTTKCQSRDQQAFNNSLVIRMREKAGQFGWVFCNGFDDKKLRDRIRCFFKTHIQNAKKRLKTMIRNPTKRANAKALVQHLDLIQQYIPTAEEEQKEAAETHSAAQQVLALSGLCRQDGLVGTK